MKKGRKAVFLILAVLFTVLLCSCGRTDMTLTVNEDGSMVARIEYGIDKSKVAGEEVIGQVTSIIKEPLDAAGIKYNEKDDSDFHRIYFEKSFKNATELTNAENWQGIPFVPQFSKTKIANAIYVTTENGNIKFEGTLNSDSFNATQVLSDDKSAFGASITIVAKKASANVGNSGTDTYKWQGTANDSVQMQLTAPYGGKDTLAPATVEKNSDEPANKNEEAKLPEPEEIKQPEPAKLPEPGEDNAQKTEGIESEIESVDEADSYKKTADAKQTESSGSGALVIVVLAVVIIAAGCAIYIKKRKNGQTSEKEEGDLN